MNKSIVISTIFIIILICIKSDEEINVENHLCKSKIETVDCYFDIGGSECTFSFLKCADITGTKCNSL